MGHSRLLGQRPCQTRVAPPMWEKVVSQPDNVVLYWFTMAQCCIETISNRQEGSSSELKSTPIAVFIHYAGGQPFLAEDQTPLTPGKYSPDMIGRAIFHMRLKTVKLASLVYRSAWHKLAFQYFIDKCPFNCYERSCPVTAIITGR